MAFPIVPILTVVGQGISAFFGFKQTQADTIKSALSVLDNTNTSNAEREKAIASVIIAEMSSGYWLAAIWRPWLMVVFAGLIVAAWFGYAPSHINEPLSPMMNRIFDLLTYGIAGYIPARTIEKIITQVNIVRALNKFIEKTVG